MSIAAINRPRPMTREQLRLVQNRLLSTWQTSAAIAQHCGLPARTVLAALQKHETPWGLEKRIIRLDGHNQVHLWRKRQRVLIMGVTFSVPGDNDEEE